MAHRIHFAGVNTRPLAEAARGQDILMSYADVQRQPALWRWLRPMIEGGCFRSVILDSGAFTELSARKRGEVFQVRLADYAAFAAANQNLFAWVANLDDIEGNTARSNANFAELEAAGIENLVPVYHEGESLDQLQVCITQARESAAQTLAVGAQRPKGSLVPTSVVRFLERTVFAHFLGVRVHGFGLTRYASPTCPSDGPFGHGFPFHSTDSTTWIAEGCAVERAGAYAALGDRVKARHAAFRATVASYGCIPFAVGRTEAVAGVPPRFDAARAHAAGGQAATVARRLAR